MRLKVSLGGSRGQSRPGPPAFGIPGAGLIGRATSQQIVDMSYNMPADVPRGCGSLVLPNTGRIWVIFCARYGDRVIIADAISVTLARDVSACRCA